MNSNSREAEMRNSSKEKKSSSETKQPLRTYGEWSEFLSSSGKIYYYSSKTEKAQWDKPEEWDYMVMEERNAKLDRQYYAPKDYKNRYRNKYENDNTYDTYMPSGGAPTKPQRFNSDYKNYSREYSSSSNDYLMSQQQQAYRQSSYPSHYGEQTSNRVPAYHMPSSSDYYDDSGMGGNSSTGAGLVGTSSSSNDYYNASYRGGGVGGSSGSSSVGYSAQMKEQQEKYWNDQRKSRSGVNPSYSSRASSTRGAEDDLRASYGAMNSSYSSNSMYDDPSSSSSHKNFIYQSRHNSRFDTFNSNSIQEASNSSRYMDASGTPSSNLNSNSSNALDTGKHDNRTSYSHHHYHYGGSGGHQLADQSSAYKYGKGSVDDYYDYYDNTAITAQRIAYTSRRASSTSSNSSSNTNSGGHSKSRKKFKKYDENQRTDSRNKSNSPSYAAPMTSNTTAIGSSSNPYGHYEKTMSTDAANDWNESNSMEASNYQENEPDYGKYPTSSTAKDSHDQRQRSGETVEHSSPSNANEMPIESGSSNSTTAVATSTNPAGASSTNSGPIASSSASIEKVDETSSKSMLQLPLKHYTFTMPLLQTSVEDLNKYYKPELAQRLMESMGTKENINWINQPFLKSLSFCKAAVELKNKRSLVRIDEIKKTIQEQRLLFLQNQMKEIEELLN